jgi:hypothetical protein
VLRLGVLIDHAMDDTGLMISGLPVGASLSAGRPVGWIGGARLPRSFPMP